MNAIQSRAGAGAQSSAPRPRRPAPGPPPPPGAPPALDWRDGPHGPIPVSRDYDDPYFSLTGGLDEARHIHLDAAALPARMAGAARFQAAELGFGAGINALVLQQAWLAARAPGGVLTLVSFEAHPMAAADMARAHAAFPALTPLSAALRGAWARTGGPNRRIALTGLDLRVIVGDARATVPAARLLAQAWLLDGFAPRRNPQMWEGPLLAAVARRTAPGGTASTYSSAGMVRRGLADAGFAVEKRPGFGVKRAMVLARLRPEGAA